MKIYAIGIMLGVRADKAHDSDDPPRFLVAAEAPEEPHMATIGMQAEFADFSDVDQQLLSSTLVVDDLTSSAKKLLLVILCYAAVLFSLITTAKILTD